MASKSVSTGLMTPLKLKIKYRIPQPFFVWSIDMRIFTHEIVMQDIPFKKMLRTQNEDFKFQRGQWPRGNRLRTNKLFTKRDRMHGFLTTIFSSVRHQRNTTQSYNHFAGHYKFD
jgi:hypothetical protein